MEENYSYLEGLNDNAKDIVIARIKDGKKNIYHSIMAILEHRRIKGELSDFENELKIYKAKNKNSIMDLEEDVLQDIFLFVYEKFLAKNNLSIADSKNAVKGGMLIALKESNYSKIEIDNIFKCLQNVLEKYSEEEMEELYLKFKNGINE